MKKKNWLFIFIALLFFVALIQLFFLGIRPPGIMTIVYQDGTPVKSVNLEQVNTSYIFVVTGAEGAENVLRIETGQILMQSSTCEDQLCVHQGAIAGEGASIVCLPNGVVIEIGR